MSSTTRGSDASVSGSRKERSHTTSERACAKQIATWLAHGFTGCKFAQSLAKRHVLLAAFDAVATPEDLDEVFETAAAGHIPAMAIFPSIRTEVALVNQLKRLASGERWEVTRPTVKGLVTDELLVGMQWTTSAGDKSTPMGFGPFPTMPVTRRAPYVCLATWPGGHENPHTHRRKPLAGAVDFLDAALPEPLTKEEFDARWDRSVARTAELLQETNDSPRYYRNVAFRLSAMAAATYDVS